MPVILGTTTGGSVLVTSGNTQINIPVVSSPQDYRFFCQLNQPVNCWQYGIGANDFIVGLDQAAGNGWFCNYLAIDQTRPNSGQVVVPATDTSVLIPVDVNNGSIYVTPTWDTEVWYTTLANGTTQINFSTGPASDSFLYYIFRTFQTGVAFAEPVTAGAVTASFELVNGATFVPFVLANWETSIGLIADTDVGIVTAVFGTEAPSNAEVVLMTQFVEPASIIPVQPTVPQQQPWVVNALDDNAYRERALNLYPQPWTSDAAKEPGGVEYALFEAYATQLAYISVQAVYAWATSRLQTANNGGLDLFSEDFFGNELPRQSGESDDNFRSRIKALLFQPQVTRQAIINAVKFFTGGIVRAIEPWNPSDTSYWGTSSPDIGAYWDWDSQQVPGLWGDPGLRYQGFMKIELPPAQGTGVNIWGFDAGAGWDLLTGIWWPPSNVFILQEIVVEKLITQLIAQGTTVWAQFVSGPINPLTAGASFQIATGIFKTTVAVPNQAGLYVLFTQLSIPVSCWSNSSTFENFNLTFAVPTSSGTWLNYLAIGNDHANVISDNVVPGQTSIHLDGDYVDFMVIPQPTWNTAVWYSDRLDTGIDFNFANAPATNQTISYVTAPINPDVGNTPIAANATEITIVLTLDNYHVPFAVANWNTVIGVLPDANTQTVLFTFATPAPSDGSGELVFLNYNVRS